MNITLWILQGVLAILYIAGGAYKTISYADLAQQIPALAPAAWRVIGVFEIIGGLLLVIPQFINWRPSLTFVAAVLLAIETLGLACLYATYSLDITAANPMVWSVVMGLLIAFVAYGRRTLRSA